MDEKLQNLIQEICRHKAGTLPRQKALNRLLGLIQTMPGIYHSAHQDYLSAWNQTLEWVCKNIDRFQINPERSVERSLVIWINGYLKWRIRDLYSSPDSPLDSLRIYPFPENQDESSRDIWENIPHPQCSLSLLEAKIAEMQEWQRQRQGEQVRDYIQADPEKKLSSCHLREKPACNCQILAYRLLLQEPPDTIATISRELGLNNKTLYSHWNKKCLLLLQEIGRRFGTKP